MLKRKDGRWQEQIKLPGMEKPKYFYGKTQREVKKKIAEWQQEQERKATVNFEDAADAWFIWHEGQVGYNAHESYNAALKRTKEYFKGQEISSITSHDVDEFIRYVSGRGYARKTVQQHRDLVNMIFNYAIINSMVAVNPCSPVKIPANLPKKERELPTDEDLKKVVEGVSLDFGLFPVMILYTGLRRGEIMALKWSDIDREKKVIHIRRSIYFVGNQPHIKDTKTTAGTRDVILLDALADLLPDKKSNAYIFGGMQPMTKSGMRRKWIAWCKQAGLAVQVERKSGKDRKGKDRIQTDWTPAVTPHQLRHAYATILYEAGIGVKDAQELMGHSSVQVTMDIYTHIRKTRKDKSAEQLNEYISESNVIDIKTGNAV